MHGLVVDHSSERGVSKQTIGGPASRSAEGRPAVPARAHRVSHRGNRRDPLPARRGSEDRRRFGLCCRPASDVNTRISSFISADVPKILALEPDLALTFFDLQADVVRDMGASGCRCSRFQSSRRRGHYGMIRKSGCRLTRNLLRRPTRVQPKQRPAVERRPWGALFCTPIRGLADRGFDRPPLSSQAIPS